MIQKRLEEKSTANKYRRSILAAGLIHVMIDFLNEVMTNQFGNYLCQKLIEAASVESLRQLIHASLPFIVDVAMDLHGTRVI